jgi:hypothetical protein
MHQDSVRRLGTMRTAQEFHVKLAGIDNPTLMVGHGPGKRRAVDLLKHSTAPKLGITITLGHGPKGRSLTLDDAIAQAKAIFGIRTELDPGIAVDAVELVGIDDHDSPLRVSMLKLTMNETRNVKKGDDRRLPYDQRRIAIRDAWNRRRPDLEMLYPIT